PAPAAIPTLSLHDALPICLLEGRMDGDLLHHCEPVVHDVVENAKQLARGKVFEHPRKIELEIGAFEVMGALLDGLIDAALSHARSEEHTSELQSRENRVCR